MNILPDHFNALSLQGVPDGCDAPALATLAREHGRVLHVASDDAHMARLEQALGFFAPEVERIGFPAWDCLPYDRVSPHGEIVGRRIGALARLSVIGDSSAKSKPLIVLTTVNALLQRVPEPGYFAGSSLSLKVGSVIATEDLTRFFERNGYIRTDTVREPGEYAVRGGIVDVFAPGSAEPSRLDFFGDDLDGIRGFDPVSQRTTAKLKSIRFLPVAEFSLDEEAVERFRATYRRQFGTEVSKDTIYESVSAGRRHSGVEHWLPLFHETMATLLDYVPTALLALDHQIDASAASRFELIAEYHDTRKSLLKAKGGEAGMVYRPLDADSLYLGTDEFAELLKQRKVVRFSPFAGGHSEDISQGEQDESPRVERDFGGRLGPSFAEARARPEINIYDAVREEIDARRANGARVLVAGYTEGSRDRLVTLLGEHGVSSLQEVKSEDEARALPPEDIAAVVLGIETGFVLDDLVVVTEQDILGERLARPSRRRRRGDEFLREVSALEERDFVVHVEHGIGRYDGLETLEIGGAPHDCIKLSYSGGDRLFVPVENIEVLSRYGSADSGAQLDKLGGAGWQARKARVKKRIRDLADQLIRIAAERHIRRTEVVAPPPGIYDEFCARFPFAETDDQLRAIDETVADLSSGHAMDRLICGDVGFGKTEVALRAAMVVAMQGYQVAVVVPTTLLARQHHQVFKDRFRGLPLKLRQLSRLVSAKDATMIKEELASGECNIVIGTHALLSKSIAFDNLGLLVVDEEQHFGVGQKERLKELRAEVHVLTLTATPIPRTLQMALSGVREMSLIATPPVDRLAVRTFVMPYDGMIIREAILREHYRGGQTFYVCPRIEDMARVHDRITKLVPEVKIASAHGRMPATELEDVMTRFVDGAFDILLSTNIVESGLDIPNANTIIIHRADMFGLSQLYQLRGRVGRSKTRAYGYLTTHPTKVLNPTAKRRLEVMQTLDSLGAGFTLASHDMDIRGAGNLLGEEQSGHVKEVGIELYQQLLHEAVEAAREPAADDAAEVAEQWSPQISLGAPVLIPEAYVSDLGLRLGLYRRIANLVEADEIDSFAAELADRFGKLPDEVENLLKVIAIKRLCKLAGVEKVDAGPKGALVTFRGNDFANLAGLVEFLGKQAGSAQLRPDHKLVYRRAWGKSELRLSGLTTLMQELVAIAA
ncbi:MAG: transcription-repair coupling factor [Rhodospirillaceae bacterium]|nr:transcription-repair coupling factor [Rhodospirillaceae bacterium]